MWQHSETTEVASRTSWLRLRTTDRRSLAVALILLLFAFSLGNVSLFGSIGFHDAERHPYRFAVDPNTAEWPELATLPGIGEKLAQAIVLYRQDHDPYREAEDLAGVRGIAAKRVAALTPFLHFPDPGQPPNAAP